MEKNVNNLANILSIFSKNLGKEILSSGLSKEEIRKKINLNYTQYWSLFFNFQIPYILRCKKIFKSSENFYIFGLCSLNEIIISELNNLKKGDISKPIFTPNGYLILKIDEIEYIKKKYDEKDEKNELNELIKQKTNQQLNQQSIIYFNKIKKNSNINEL